MTDRLPYCGGTDAAAIVCSAQGLPYYRSAWEVWAERHAPDALPKRSPVEQGWLDLGNALEGYVLSQYAARIRDDGLTVAPGIRLYGPAGYTHLRGTLDACVTDATGQIVGIVDAKTSRLRRHWWTEDDEGQRMETQPPGYEVQVRWYMGLARIAGHPVAFADLCPLDLMSAKVEVRTLPHDEGQWGGILGIVLPWWERHIVHGERPADDHSEACERWHLYCQPRARTERQIADDERPILARWVAAKAALKAAEVEASAASVALLDRMDCERLTGFAAAPGTKPPYVQVQNGPHGSRVLRGYRFPDLTPKE